MAGPGDEIAAGAGGRGHLRASHGDREQVIDTLKVAFVQGMLAKDEFDLRVGQAFAARTYADLAAVTADLAAKPTAAQPSKPAAAEGQQPVLQPGPVIKVASVLYAVAWLVALLVPWPKDGDGDPMGGILLVFFSTPIYLFILFAAVASALANRRERRSGGQPPRRPALGVDDHVSPCPPPDDPEGQLPAADHGHQHTAEAARRRFPWPPLPVRGHCAGSALGAETAPASW
jgi:hypothetical protein